LEIGKKAVSETVNLARHTVLCYIRVKENNSHNHLVPVQKGLQGPSRDLNKRKVRQMRKPMFIQTILLTGVSRTLFTAAVLAVGLMASSCNREACPGAITRTDQPQEPAIESSNPQQAPEAGSTQQGTSSLRVQG